MMRSYFFICLLCASFLFSCETDDITFEVHAGDYTRTDCLVSVTGPQVSIPDIQQYTLYETTGKKKQVPFQISHKDNNTYLYWVMEGETKAGSTRTFSLKYTKNKNRDVSAMKVEDTHKALIVKQDDKPVLQYNYGFTEAPEGVDPAFGRSGYIHPLYSPSGTVLTNIQPHDHYHHYGIWNPWTRIEYKGNMYDLWNLGDKLGTVKAKDISTVYEGNIFAGYLAGLQHYIFTPEGEKNIMDESWNIQVYNMPERFLLDFESTLSPATGEPVIIKEYRYAGFSIRATDEWVRENSVMVTSEGKTRQQIDGSTARWVYATGDTKNGRCGILFLGHPDNYNHPEPLRIWDENANGGRGDVFINFAPTKDKDWTLLPGKEYSLKYRVSTYDGEMTPERAEQLWNDFTHPPVVTILTNRNR